MRQSAFSRLLLLTGVLLALAGVAYGQVPFTITPGPLSDGAVTKGYFASITTSGASSGTITWSVLSGNFPPGLVLNQGTPNTFISGTATQAGSFTFTIQAVDSGITATQQFSININTLLVINTPPTLHSATANANYQTNLIASGGVSPYFWSLSNDGVTTGALPPGMVLKDNGLITGVSLTPGDYTFVAYVNDFSSSYTQFDSRTFTITVNPPVSITSTSLPGGVVGIPYTGQLNAKDGNTRYQWTVTGGALPPGLSMFADGSITGVPNLAGTFNFRALVTDLYGSTASASFVISIAGRLAITTAPPLPVGVIGVPYSVKFEATTASQPVTWQVSVGPAPPGLTLDPATGILAGTPTTAGNFSFTIRAEDASKDSTTRGFTIAVTESLAITTTTLPDGTVGIAYSQTVTATGGTKPYAFSIGEGGSLPAGLTLDPSTGAITGKPTQAGASTFNVLVRDATQATASKQLSINVVAALAFTTESPLPGATGGSPYSQAIAVTGGTQPYTFKIDSGSAPTGVTLDAAGALAGTPTSLGDFHFVVRVTDAIHSTLTKAYDLTVAAPTVPPPTIGGVNDTEPPAEQPTLSLELAHAYPLPLNGTMALTFASAEGEIDDPAIQFSNGKRTADFTVPAGSTPAVFSDNNLLLSTGTVAGTITLTLQFEAGGQDVTPAPAPTRVIQILPQAPVISAVTASRNSTGFQVVVTGFSNTREMVSSAFQFQAVSGTTLQTDHAEPAVDQIFATWYSDANSQQFGSQFTFTQPFTVTGNVNGVAGVTVKLANAQGTSNEVTATVQ